MAGGSSPDNDDDDDDDVHDDADDDDDDVEGRFGYHIMGFYDHYNYSQINVSE